MSSFWTHKQWRGGRCKRCQENPPANGHCSMSTGRKKCGRCTFHGWECVFDTPEETAAARNPPRSPPQSPPRSFSLLPPVPQTKRHEPFEPYTTKIKVKIESQISGYNMFTTMWVKARAFVGEVRLAWCKDNGIGQSSWEDIKFFIESGSEVLDTTRCETVVEWDTAMRRTSSIRADNGINQDVEFEDLLPLNNRYHKIHFYADKTSDFNPSIAPTIESDDSVAKFAFSQEDDPGRSNNLDEEPQQDAEEEYELDDEYQRIYRRSQTPEQLIAFTISSLLPNTVRCTLKIGEHQTVWHVIREWYKRQPPAFQHDKWELVLKHRNECFMPNKSCREVLGIGPSWTTSPDLYRYKDHYTFAHITTFRDAWGPHLQDEREAAQQRVYERDQHGPRLPLPDPETEQDISPEPCNGIHYCIDTMSASQYGVKIIVTSQIPETKPMYFYRHDEQKVSDVMLAWKRNQKPFLSHSILYVKGRQKLLPDMKWSEVSQHGETFSDERDKEAVTPLRVQVMTEDSYRAMIAEHRDRIGANMDCSGTRVMATASSSMLGKRPREP